jgi:hypothetical protein
MAVFSFKSTFVKFKVERATTYYMSYDRFSLPSFRTADNVPASVYKGMSWDPKSPDSVQWSEKYKDERTQLNLQTIPVVASVPFVTSLLPDSAPLITRRYCSLLIVNDGVPVTLELSGDANKSEGYYAHAKVASVSVVNQP